MLPVSARLISSFDAAEAMENPNFRYYVERKLTCRSNEPNLHILPSQWDGEHLLNAQPGKHTEAQAWPLANGVIRELPTCDHQALLRTEPGEEISHDSVDMYEVSSKP